MSGSQFSPTELALSAFAKMDAAPLEEYMSLCSMVMALLEDQRQDSLGNIQVPKETIVRVIKTSSVMALMLNNIKSTMIVNEPASVEESLVSSMRMIEAAKEDYNPGDVLYFLPRCCQFHDIPPGVPFVVLDNFVAADPEDIAFPKKYAIEVAFIGKNGTVMCAIVDRRRLSKEKHEISKILDMPSTATVS